MPESEEVWYREARSLQYFFHRQGLHFFALLILIPTTWSLAAPVLENGDWLGIQTTRPLSINSSSALSISPFLVSI